MWWINTLIVLGHLLLLYACTGYGFFSYKSGSACPDCLINAFSIFTTSQCVCMSSLCSSCSRVTWFCVDPSGIIKGAGWTGQKYTINDTLKYSMGVNINYRYLYTHPSSNTMLAVFAFISSFIVFRDGYVGCPLVFYNTGYSKVVFM